MTDQHKLYMLIIFALVIIIMFLIVDSRIGALDDKVDRIIRLVRSLENSTAGS